MTADAPATVLVVEDDPGIAELERQRLEDAGYRVVLAGSAEEAARLVRSGGIDLVLLDYRLSGGVDGLDFYARLQEDGFDPPVILVTGFSDEATVIRALRAGVRDFVTKSVEYLDYLPEAVGRVLRQVRTEQQFAESEARLAAVIGSAKDAVIVTEADRTIGLFNPAAERMFRCPAAAALGRPITDFIPDELAPPPGTPDGPDAHTVSHRLRAGARGVRAGGAEFPLEASVSRGQANGRRFYTVVVRDVTERKRAEEALQAAKEEWEQSFHALSDYICILDRSGAILRANRAMRERFEPAHGDLVGLDYRLVYCGTADPDPPPPCAATLAAGTPVSHEGPLAALDGWYHVVVRPLFTRDGGQWGAVSVVRDVTGRRRTEERLRLFGAAVEQEGSSIIITTADLDPPGPRIVFVNPAFERMTGYRAGEVIGKTPRILQGAKTDRAVLDRLRAALGAGEAFDGEAINYRKDGSEFHLGWHINPIRDAGGRVTHFVSVQRDITERKRAEERIREQAALLDLAHDAIKAEGLDGTIRYWNRGAEALFGWSAGEAVGRNAVGLIYAGESAELREARRRVAEGGEWTGLLRQVTRAGREIVTQTRWSLIRGPAGRPTGVLVICTDATERERLGAQLRQAQKMEVVGRLAGGVAHDFNNLLTVINGYSDLLLNGLRPGDPMRDMVEEVRKAGERASGLTRQLLALSRQQVLEPRVLDVNAVVRDSATMLRRLIGEDVKLETRFDPGLRRVKADPGQVEQVVMNLAVNARDAMPTGGRLVIETGNADLHEAARPGGRPGPYVLLRVTDAGHGMTDEVKAQIFDPFFTTKEVGKGTGLGLATVQGIVSQAGGHVEVESEVGRGTTFSVYLPATAEAADGSKTHPALRETSRGRETVLLAEDDAALRAFAGGVLRTAGYTVLEAGEGAGALAVCERHPGRIDVLVTDVVMPGLGGRHLAERVAELRPGVKVLYLSGYTPDAVVRHGVEQAVVAFLQKPFSPAALARKVREVLDGAGEG